MMLICSCLKSGLYYVLYDKLYDIFVFVIQFVIQICGFVIHSVIQPLSHPFRSYIVDFDAMLLICIEMGSMLHSNDMCGFFSQQVTVNPNFLKEF